MPTPASFRSKPWVLRLKGLVGPAVDRVITPLEPLRRPISRTDKPILVCGCPHSGTTVVARYIGQHPNVHTVPYESNLFCTARPKWTIARAFRDWSRESQARGRDRVCEKTPSHVFHLDRIFRCYPGARVVLVERDGRDVVASLTERGWADVDRAARTWVAAIEASRQWWADERLLVVRYDFFVAETEATVVRIAEHIGEPYTPRMLDEDPSWQWRSDLGDINERPASAAGQHHDQYRAWQARQPVFDGRGRWRESLSEEDRDRCREIIGPLLHERGYASEADRW